MCYAIPGKIVSIKSNLAIVDYFGERKKVLTDFSQVKINDYVYAQGGIIINKIPALEAQAILRLWQKNFFKLQKLDQKISQINPPPFSRIRQSKDRLNNAPDQTDKIIAIEKKVGLMQALADHELLTLLNLNHPAELKLLWRTANNIRQKNQGNACCVHGIIEFSNYCRNDCHYCGIRKSAPIQRYRLTPDQIIKTARVAVRDWGFKALVLQSGEDLWYTEKILGQLVREIKKLKVLVFLSIGQRDKTTYQKLYQAGARANLLRFETSNKKIFEQARPRTTLAKRLDLINHTKKIGYILATGFLVGLPNETPQDIINNIRLAKSLKADMYSFGPVIPAPHTPLKDQGKIDLNLMLKIIALTRLIDRQAKILITSALETLDPKAKKLGLLAGANSLMINLTPAVYQKKYSIYPRWHNLRRGVKENIKETLNLLYALGRAPTDLGI